MKNTIDLGERSIKIRKELVTNMVYIYSKNQSDDSHPVEYTHCLDIIELQKIEKILYAPDKNELRIVWTDPANSLSRQLQMKISSADYQKIINLFLDPE